MKYKLTFLAGAAAGYVLGARAGRDRYEEMKRSADALWHDPRVQEKVGSAADTVKDKAPDVGAKLADVAGSATSAAKDKVAQVRDKDRADRDLDIPAAKGTDYTPRVTKTTNR